MKGSLIKSNLATIGRLEDREKALLREAKAAGGPLADEVAAARAAEKQMAATCAAARRSTASWPARRARRATPRRRAPAS